MKKRWIVWFTMLAVICLAILALASPLRLILLGLIRNEHFYKGRPTSDWSSEVRGWSQSRFGVRRERGPLIEKLMKFLNLSDEVAKPQVLQGGRTAMQVLIDLLKDEDAHVRREAAAALGNLGPLAKDAIPALSETLNDQDRTVRYQAAEAVGHISPKALVAIVEARKDNDPEFRWIATQALLGGRVAIPAVPGRGGPGLRPRDP